jgi:hypothetical protein
MLEIVRAVRIHSRLRFRNNSRIEGIIMKHLKGLQRTLLCSALAVLAFGSTPALAIGGPAFGNCVGAPSSPGPFKDCVTAVGHISASVVGTLSINEMRGISFGNFAVTGAGGGTYPGSTITLDLQGNRVETDSGTPANDAIVLMHGATAGGAGPSGAQSPGHYTVTGGSEGNTVGTQVYISFADSAGNIVDTCNPGVGFVGTTAVCDTYHPGNNQNITLAGPALSHPFYIDHFVFNQGGEDVFGHYIANDGTNGGGVGNPGITNPYGPGNTPTGGAGVVDVVVGARLTDDGSGAAGYPPGKYTGTYNIMVSY